MIAPLVYRCVLHNELGLAMVPLGRFARQAHDQFEPEQTYFLGEVEVRSEVSHRHEFAWLREAWQTLPEGIAADYPSAEHLRKRALINTGWCNVRDYACASRAEAVRLAAALRGELDEYTVVVVSDASVRVLRAKSQGKGKMSPADFQKSKTDILEWVSNLLGVDPSDLSAREPATAASAA